MTRKRSRYARQHDRKPGAGIVPAIPLAFALPASKSLRLAMPEKEAIDALLAHKATPEQFGICETVVETWIRAIEIAKEAPHCKHLEPAGLDRALRDYQRAGHALIRAKWRHDTGGVYGLDATDRACILEMAEWNRVLSEPGGIPRAVVFAAIRDGATRADGVVLPAWEYLQ